MLFLGYSSNSFDSAHTFPLLSRLFSRPSPSFFSSSRLPQGTLRPDLIESASELVSETAHSIKTHHNDTLLVQEMRKQGRVIEPLVDFHKDEVRQLGEELGEDRRLEWEKVRERGSDRISRL